MLKKPYLMAIIDDDEDIIEITESYVEDLYPNVFSVHTFLSPDMAKEFIQRNDVQFVLTDLKMPEEYGDSFLNEIRERNRNIQSVIITGYPSFVVMTSAYWDGFQGFIVKPFEMEDLKKVLDPCIDLVDQWYDNIYKKYAK